VSRILHILTKAEDPLALEIIRLQREQAALEIEMIDLTGGQADYATLLQRIFAADSVEVW
jgi:hypothetical protein